ncbi:hypothetical protein CVT26_011635 [Gymnopilus dilepis]|uniref:Uncharacterized protein n=1 Tax=Gymnopilus dilepis TaxID=231916 RepID=A0A409YQM0_9AGAR|nr:hypothetical protein CVT26_011635 [Gymnopilus dilepis]
MMDNPRRDEKALRYLHHNLEHDFDREAYIEAIQTQYPNCCAPEEFRMWILEWPAKLFVNSIWPGLPFTVCLLDNAATGGSSRRSGVNYFARKPPVVLRTEEWRDDGKGVRRKIGRVCVLLIWATRWHEFTIFDPYERRIRYSGSDDPGLVRRYVKHELMYTDLAHKPISRIILSQWDHETWLMLDPQSPYFGKVMDYPLNFGASGGVFSEETLGLTPAACPDWITYLEARWFGRVPRGHALGISESVTRTAIPRVMVDLPMRRTELDKPGVLPQYVADKRYLRLK